MSQILKNKKLKDEVEQLQIRLTNVRAAVNLSSIVSCTDLRGKITYVNQNFIDISGYSVKELIGKPHHIVNSGIHPKSFWVEMWKDITRGKIWHNEVCNRRKDGALYWVDTFIYPNYDTNGKLVDFLSIRNDITRRKEHEIELHNQNDILSEIAWAQSHEMRRPVASILGLVQLMEKDTFNIPEHEMIAHLKCMATELDIAIKKNVTRIAEADTQFKLKSKWNQ